MEPGIEVRTTGITPRTGPRLTEQITLLVRPVLCLVLPILLALAQSRAQSRLSSVLQKNFFSSSQLSQLSPGLRVRLVAPSAMGLVRTCVRGLRSQSSDSRDLTSIFAGEMTKRAAPLCE